MQPNENKWQFEAPDLLTAAVLRQFQNRVERFLSQTAARAQFIQKILFILSA
jgi:hypothetical protein